jgi:hypothetical protein
VAILKLEAICAQNFAPGAILATLVAVLTFPAQDDSSLVHGIPLVTVPCSSSEKGSSGVESRAQRPHKALVRTACRASRRAPSAKGLPALRASMASDVL